MRKGMIGNSRGFSLIELMVVIVILGILAGTLMPRLMGRTDEAKTTKCRVDIQALATALNLYRLDNGSYPSTEQGLKALISSPEGGRGYLEKKSLPKDPWGRAFIYLSPGAHGDYDLISYGADGVPGGGGKDGDINNWESE